MFNRIVDFKELLGKTITHINRGDSYEGDFLEFTCQSGEIYKQYHERDCCESVYIEDINGNLDDLLNFPILEASENYKNNTDKWGESETWVFYRLATVKGYVVIRWYGSSNGYYSEQAGLYRIK